MSVEFFAPHNLVFLEHFCHMKLKKRVFLTRLVVIVYLILQSWVSIRGWCGMFLVVVGVVRGVALDIYSFAGRWWWSIFRIYDNAQWLFIVFFSAMVGHLDFKRLKVVLKVNLIHVFFMKAKMLTSISNNWVFSLLRSLHWICRLFKHFAMLLITMNYDWFGKEHASETYETATPNLLQQCCVCGAHVICKLLS